YRSFGFGLRTLTSRTSVGFLDVRVFFYRSASLASLNKLVLNFRILDDMIGPKFYISNNLKLTNF
ncbi:hypothetical protein RhiirA4_471067, partial [Rhizophagus irregularis]